jgi:hypothetical protein
LSVLVYRPLDEIRSAVDRLRFDRCTAMDVGRDRVADWRWFAARAASRSTTSLGGVRPLQGLLGMPIRPFILQRLNDALARHPSLDLPRQVQGQGQLGLGPGRGLDAPSILSDLLAFSKSPNFEATTAELAHRNEPPRVLALLQEGNALIVFRGTDGAADWRRNLCFWPASAHPLRHCGFNRTWEEVKPLVESWLAEATATLGRHPTVYLGGHSLGGGPWRRSRQSILAGHTKSLES